MAVHAPRLQSDRLLQSLLFWALQIRLCLPQNPRIIFHLEFPPTKKLRTNSFSEKKQNLKNSTKLGHFRRNSTQVFVDLKKNLKKSLNKLAPSWQQQRHQSQPRWLINGRRLHLSESTPLRIPVTTRKTNYIFRRRDPESNLHSQLLLSGGLIQPLSRESGKMQAAHLCSLITKKKAQWNPVMKIWDVYFPLEKTSLKKVSFHSKGQRWLFDSFLEAEKQADFFTETTISPGKIWGIVLLKQPFI